MRLVLLVLYVAMTAALLLGAAIRIGYLLTTGAEVEWLPLAAGALGLLALVGLLAAGRSVWRAPVEDPDWTVERRG